MSDPTLQQIAEHLDRLALAVEELARCRVDEYVTMHDVQRMIRRSRSTIEEMLRDSSFPQPDSYNGRTRLWRRSTVTAWMDATEEQRPHRGRTSRLRELTTTPTRDASRRRTSSGRSGER